MTSNEFIQWMDDLDLTYKKAAKLLGVCETSIRNYRRGWRASNRSVVVPPTIERLCLLLKKEHKAGRNIFKDLNDA